jgi:hypothetical protein
VSYTRRFDRDLVIREQQPICDWLHANGIDYTIVPLDARVTFDRRNMTVDAYVRGPGGGIQLKADWTAPIRTTLTVPIRRRPPVLASLGPATRTRGAAR